MNELMCEMCGSNMVTREGGFYVCQACGTKFPVNDPANRSEQSSSYDSFSELDNLYELARRARDRGDAEFGHRYYSEILIRNPNDWEAQYYSGYYRAFLYDYLDENAVDELYYSIASAVEIVEGLEDDEEKNEAIKMFTDETFGLVESFYDAYLEQLEYAYSEVEDYEWYLITILELSYLLNNYGDLVENVTDDTFQDALDSWIYSIDIHTPMYKYISFFDKGEHDKYIDGYVEKIHEYNPDYEKPKPKKLFGIL